MPLLVFDAADPPSLAGIKEAGGVGGARYIKKNLPNAYDLQPAERLKFLNAGLGLLYNAEQSANDVLVQSTSYFADYGKYVADRLQSFGVNPAGVNIPLSSDCQVSDTALPKAMNNLAAFAANCGPFGMIGYAQTNVLELLSDEGISPKGAKHWLTGSIGWSKGYANNAASWNEYIQFPYAGMVQLGPQAIGWWNGTSFTTSSRGAPVVAGCDTNLLLDPTAMGFEWPTGSPYAPKKKEPDMTQKVGYIAGDTSGDFWFISVDVNRGKQWLSPTTAAALLQQVDFDGAKLYDNPPIFDQATLDRMPSTGAVTAPPASGGAAATFNLSLSGTATPEASA